MRAHEIMNLKDHVADLDCIISILNSEGEWELADDLIKISKSFEEVVESCVHSQLTIITIYSGILWWCWYIL